MKKNLLAFILLAFVLSMFCGCNSMRERDTADSSTSFDTTNSVNSETIISESKLVSSTTLDSDIASSDLKLNGNPYGHTVSIEDYLEELPDFSVSYLDAELPKELQNFLDTDGVFELVFDTNSVDFRYDSDRYYSTNYFATIYASDSKYFIARPVIYYDNGELYIQGINMFDYSLIQYSFSSDTVDKISENVDVLGVENVSIIATYPTEHTTLVSNGDNSFSLYRLGKEAYTFKVNADPNMIELSIPFIDNDNNLVQLKVNPYSLDDTEFIIIENDVINCYKGYDDEETFYDLIDGLKTTGYVYRLYEKNDGSYFIYGYNYNYNQLPDEEFSYLYTTDYTNLDELFTDVELRVIDEVCFLHIGNINIPDAVFSDLDMGTPIWGSKITSSANDETLNDFFNKPFKFSESSEKIEQLLTYIKK